MTVNTRLHSLWKYNFDLKSNRYIVIFACFLRFHKLGLGLRFAPVLIFLHLTNCSTLLSLQIEMESQKNTATNLERISGDYKQMKEENNVLAKKLKAAKWVNRRLFYTNRYFLMNNASRNKEFDWSDIFCSLLSLLFLFESLMNHCCGPMARHVHNLEVRATRKSSNVTVYVVIPVTALFWVFWPIIKSPNVVTDG